jgi:hypothetical protein
MVCNLDLWLLDSPATIADEMHSRGHLSPSSTPRIEHAKTKTSTSCPYPFIIFLSYELLGEESDVPALWQLDMMAVRRGILSDIPDFTIFTGAAQCTTNHNSGASQSELVGGLMVSTSKLSKSAQRGCPWCSMFWEAFKRSVGTNTPGPQDFIYWRYDGESFFEPWCTAQSCHGKGEFKIQIYTDGMPPPFSPCPV